MNKEDVIKNKNEAIKMMTDYLDNCLAIDDSSNIKKVNLISYWQKDYINYSYNSQSLSIYYVKI